MESLRHARRGLGLLLLALLIGVAWQAGAEEPAKPAPTGGAAAVAAKATSTGPYMRVVDADDNTVRLDLAVKFFTPSSGRGPTIALAAAIHIADAPFYELAQHYLDAQDLVLFEGVGPGHEKGDATPAARVEQSREHLRAVAIMLERYKALKGEYPTSLDALVKTVRQHDALKGTRLQRATIDAWKRPLRYQRVDPGAGGGPGFALVSLGADGKEGGEAENADLRFADQPALKKAELTPGGGIQNDLADALGLAFQLNKVDTGKPNYRNADMTLEQLQARMKETGGDMGAMLKMMDGSSMMAGVVKLGLGLIKASPQMQATVKVMLSEMLRDMGDDISRIKGVPKSMQALMKTLIDDRNQTVIDELKKELASGQKSEDRSQKSEGEGSKDSGSKTQDSGLRTQDSGPKSPTPFSILTHCNAGALATGGIGTATFGAIALTSIGRHRRTRGGTWRLRRERPPEPRRSLELRLPRSPPRRGRHGLARRRLRAGLALHGQDPSRRRRARCGTRPAPRRPSGSAR